MSKNKSLVEESLTYRSQVPFSGMIWMSKHESCLEHHYSIEYTVPKYCDGILQQRFAIS